MRTPLVLAGLVLAFLAAGCGGDKPSSGAKPTLRFSGIPDTNTTNLQEKFEPFAAYLSEALGVPVEYVPTADYAASVAAFTTGQIQLAWFGGLSGVQARHEVAGAHAIAPEYKEKPQEYVDLVSETMLPLVKGWWETHAPRLGLPFVDVFCETGAFTLEQSRQILIKARSLGFPLKIHADEFDNLGGASLAVELGAASADHLVKTSDADIAALGKSDTVAVSLPCTPFGLAEFEYTPAQKILDADGILAIATDCNPGTAWNESMQFVIALACRALKLTPAQAIAASTINSAHAIRRADKIGSIEEGKQADMLVLSVPDYRHLGYRFGTNLVKQVIKRGSVYSVDVGYYRTA